MTIVPLFLLTLGAINWGYAYPLVFLFVALLRQRMLGREIYFNFLYAPGFWLLLSAGMTYALIGMRTISGVYHHGILPVVAFAIGWLIAEGSSDKQIRDGILALAAGFGTYATLNMLVNIGNNRYRLIDFWTGTYRAATGSGALRSEVREKAPGKDHVPCVVFCHNSVHVHAGNTNTICDSSADRDSCRIAIRIQRAWYCWNFEMSWNHGRYQPDCVSVLPFQCIVHQGLYPKYKSGGAL